MPREVRECDELDGFPVPILLERGVLELPG